MRALIVDDSIVMRIIVEQALRDAVGEPLEVVTARNGADALAILAAAADFDLILSDVHMPIMGGLEFVHERTRLGLAQGVPLLMITADTSDPIVTRAIADGAQGYISKPFTAAQVRSSVLPLIACRV